jgi:integrase/recombinase XerD
MHSPLPTASITTFFAHLVKEKCIDDALIQLSSGHENLALLVLHSKILTSNAQDTYNEKIKNFPV